uniref:transposon-encoded TnpW family protein n=2 Tax=Enterocloster clostridioformis TaxID=1531 RepID=UPI0025A53554|nr:transposon-encoded TnpW family protein [Enterocloster clostridioformis]
MTENSSNILIRRIGSTTYKVRAFFREDGTDTMEDKILQMIRREGLASPPDCGMMNVPQMNRHRQLRNSLTKLYALCIKISLN